MKAPIDYYRFDGQTYMKGDELPDLGSIRCINPDEAGDTRKYEGKIEDEDKLENINYAPDGSSAMLIGSGTKIFHSLDGEWIELR